MTRPQYSDSVRLSDVLDAWPQLVGRDIADRCHFASFSGRGVLCLWVRTTDARRELMAGDVAATLRATLPPVIDNVPVRVVRFDVLRNGDQ